MNFIAKLADTKRAYYYSSMINSISGDQKALYKFCNQLLDKQKSCTFPETDDNYALAQQFNKFFVDKVNKIRMSIPSSSSNVCNSYTYISPIGEPSLHNTANSSSDPSLLSTSHSVGEPSLQNNLNSFMLTNEQEIREIVQARGLKSSSCDPLPTSLLKTHFDSLLPYITKIVNVSLMNGSLDGLKSSIITPILKNSSLDHNCMVNYRPITELSFLSKIIERVVLKQLDNHMSLHNLHCDQQLGYKKNHSTELLLLNMMDDVFKACDNSMGVVVIQIDL